MNQSLLFPLVFWDGPPKHDVTAVTVGDGYVATGALSGELCLWKLVEEPPRHHEDWIGGKYLKPVVAMVCESASRITALQVIKRGWDHQEMILAGDIHGSIALWDSSGGRCHFSRKVLRRAVSSIVVIPMSITAGDRGLIACFTRNTNQVNIVDVTSLSTIAVLTSPEVFTDTIVVTVSKVTALLSITRDGTLLVWILDTLSELLKTPTADTPQIGPSGKIALRSLLEALARSGTPTRREKLLSFGGFCEISASPSGKLLCIRRQGGFFTILSAEGVINNTLEGTNLAETDSVLISNASLETDQEREIRETEGDKGIEWQGCEFIDENKSQRGVLVFYSKDGTTRIVTILQSEVGFEADIEHGPPLLRSHRSALKKALSTDIPTTSRNATEDLEFLDQKERGENEAISGWETCRGIRIRAVGVGLLDHLDRRSTSDPYLQVYSGDELLWETEVVHNSPNPHWREILLEKSAIDAKRPLRFLVFEKGDIVDDLIGSLDVTLSTLVKMAKNCTLPLYQDGKKDSPTNLGSIRFKSVELEVDDNAEEPAPPFGNSQKLGEMVDNFEMAAGVKKGRPRSMFTGGSNIAPVRLRIAPDGLVVAAGGSGLIQIWMPCTPPPPEFAALAPGEKSALRNAVASSRGASEEKLKEISAKVSEIAKGYPRTLHNRLSSWLGMAGEKGKGGIGTRLLKNFEEERGLRSPVFWIGDAFDALQSNPCTASVLAAGGGRGSSSVALLLARGYKQGGIVAASLLDGQKHVTFKGHRAEVTCIVAVPPEQSPTGSSVLVSGGLDGCVCVWDLRQQKRLGMFRCRSPVLSLHWPQASEAKGKSSGQHSGDLVMAVTADHGVHIVSLSELEVVQVLQGHDSRVAAIYRNRWAMESDYIVTQTLSGVAYLWSLSTGHLDRMLSRKDAYSFLLTRGLLDPSKEKSFLQGSETEVRLTSSSNTTVTATIATPGAGVLAPGDSPGIMSSRSSPMVSNLKDEKMRPLALEAPARSASVAPSARQARMSHRQSFTFTKRKMGNSHVAQRFPVDSKSLRSSVTRLPLMQVCPLGRAGGVLRANMFCINVNRLIHDLRTQYRHLSSRPASRRGSFDTLQAVLSFLFEWGVEASIDKILSDQFGFRRPYPTPAFGVMSYRAKAVALLLPEASKGNSRWELCPTLTAIHSLSLSALCMTMLSASHPSKQVYYTQVVSHYGVHLPDHLKTYVEPSVEVLVIYSYNQTEEVHMASRLLLQGVIERSSQQTLKKIVERWTSPDYFSTKLVEGDIPQALDGRPSVCQSGTLSPFFETPVLSRDPVMDRRLTAALVLCLIAADQQRKRQKHKDRSRNNKEDQKKTDTKSDDSDTIKLSAAIAGQITETLLKVIYDICSREESNAGHGLTTQDIVVSSLAAELMGKGFFLWRRHVGDAPSLISKLHRLSLIKRAALAGAAHRALLQAGQSAPRSFIRQMGNEALNLRSKPRCRSGALFAIVALVKKYPSSLVSALPSAVQIIIKCLDPSAPALRKSLLRPATAALHALVQNYPSVTFHQKSQRFAVGTTARTSSVIVIYDLRTATKWRILSGHTATITAVSFNPSAAYIASYSPDEQPANLKIWETGSQGP
ncbi:hypothetical protein AAMO2058_000240700 [Amorphochlora amoebiformis]